MIPSSCQSPGIGSHLIIAVGSLVILLGPARYSCALTPDSPEVKAAVQRATEYLKTANGGRVGATALIGLALLKSGVSREDPTVVEAINVVRREVSKSIYDCGEIYTPSVFVTFLVEADAEQYAPEIKKLVNYLESAARPYGGWGYRDGDNSRTADTSMTQYALLALWEANESGIPVSIPVVEKAAVWLSKTQDPSGGFGYQGTISTGAGLVPQTGVSVSLTTAGLCASYLAEDILGLLARQKEEDNLPEALTKVEKGGKGGKTTLARTFFSSIQGPSNAWLEKNLTFNITYYQFYFAYIYERYWALRMHGGDRPNSDWYNWLAQQLLPKQAKDGSWPGHHGAAIETAFCVLSLVKAMNQSVKTDQTYGTGNLVGGRDLPKDSDTVQFKNGTIVNQTDASALESRLKDITNTDGEDYAEAIGELSELSPDEAKSLISREAARLRDLAGGTSADKRLVAVQTLARAGTLDDVPTLIYALTDPEPDIVLAALGGLRRISRKIHGFGLPDEFDEEDRRMVIGQWKAWYLAIRPNAKFEN